jgi:hypothetical protein
MRPAGSDTLRHSQSNLRFILFLAGDKMTPHPSPSASPSPGPSHNAMRLELFYIDVEFELGFSAFGVPIESDSAPMD